MEAKIRLRDVLSVQDIGYILVSVGHMTDKVIQSFFCASEICIIDEDGLDIGCGQWGLCPPLYTIPSPIEHEDFIWQIFGVSRVFLGVRQKLLQLGEAHMLCQEFGGALVPVQTLHSGNVGEYIALQNSTTNGLHASCSHPSILQNQTWLPQTSFARWKKLLGLCWFRHTGQNSYARMHWSMLFIFAVELLTLPPAWIYTFWWVVISRCSRRLKSLDAHHIYWKWTITRSSSIVHLVECVRADSGALCFRGSRHWWM